MTRLVTRMRHFAYWLACMFYCSMSYAQDTTGIADIDNMLQGGQSMIKVAAKWGGILTVVCAAIALGRGRLEGALAHHICKILIVIGLLVSAFTYFAPLISWGLAF